MDGGEQVFEVLGDAVDHEGGHLFRVLLHAALHVIDDHVGNAVSVEADLVTDLSGQGLLPQKAFHDLYVIVVRVLDEELENS